VAFRYVTGTDCRSGPLLSGRGKTSLADRAQWAKFYTGNFSLWLDLKSR
jgi:hypothetical protein